jgi:ATP-binding cassette subfamily F protein 3
LEGKTVLAHAMDIHEQIHAIRDELREVQNSLETETDRERVQELAHRQTELLDQQEHLGGYDLESRALKILAGLGFREEVLSRLVSTLSGGWVMRLELVRLLLSVPDLLLLDEPTNHLDLESLLWLEQYLLSCKSAVLLISHDRVFLNRVVTRILDLEQGQLQEYTGNYDAFLEEKARRQEIQLASYNNQQDRFRQIERFIERNRYRKDRARQVQSRLKLMGKMEQIEAPLEQDAEISFVFPTPPRSGKRVIELCQVDKSYGENVVYQGVDLLIERTDRIAFLGVNGAGKSTLLKILAGVESISGGQRIVGHQAALGYYAQYQWEQLHSDWTVLEEASSVSGDLIQSRLRSLLGSFLFRGDDVLKRVSVLSGGEKARLILCKLLLERPNVLLLDEPTNHLDIPSRDVLEKAVEEFPGAVCFISHDRHFIDAIANKILFVDSGGIHLFPGNYNDFQNIWKKRLEDGPPREAGQPESAVDRVDRKANGPSPPTVQEQKRLEAQWRNELYRLKKPLQERIEKAETLLDEAQKRAESLGGRLADPLTYQDGTNIQQLKKDYHDCRQRIQELTDEWEASSLELEELEESFWKDKTRGSGR